MTNDITFHAGNIYRKRQNIANPCDPTRNIAVNAPFGWVCPIHLGRDFVADVMEPGDTDEVKLQVRYRAHLLCAMLNKQIRQMRQSELQVLVQTFSTLKHSALIELLIGDGESKRDPGTTSAPLG